MTRVNELAQRVRAKLTDAEFNSFADEFWATPTPPKSALYDKVGALAREIITQDTNHADDAGHLSRHSDAILMELGYIAL